MYSESYLMTKSKKALVGMLLKMDESELQQAEVDDIEPIKVGDIVISLDDRVGYIKSVCDCDMCKERGWFEPEIYWVDDPNDYDYIPQCESQHLPSKFKRIGANDFQKNVKKQLEDIEPIKVEDIERLEITDVEVWNEDDNKSIGIRFSWNANIGWGTYTIGYSCGEWYVDDEYMESPEDRKFGKLVFATWLDSLKNNPQYMFGE